MAQLAQTTSRTRRDAGQRRFLMWTVIPMVLYMAFWTLFPLLWGFSLSLFDYSSRRAGGALLGLGGDNPFIGLQNFASMLDFSDSASSTIA
jgi:ABC-type sugar transport system permease subunit